MIVIRCLSRALQRVALTVIVVLVLAPAALAVNHDLGEGEPYSLAGKRLVFTNWVFIRPGQLDWADDKGNSVYATGGHGVDAKGHPLNVGPSDAHFRDFLAPHGIRLISEPAHRLDKPVISIERPWEANGISVGGVLFDEGKYRMWAQCFDAKNQNHWCYYESFDGMKWDRPNLGLVEYQGSKDNNLILGKCGAVFKDLNAPPSERYKAALGGYASYYADPDFFEKEWKGRFPYSVMAVEANPAKPHAILAAVSPDGLRWTQVPEPLSVEGPTHQVVMDFDPLTRKYILYTCSYMVGPRARGTTRPTGRLHGFVARYAIGRTESDDWHRFPPSNVILESENDWLPTDDLFTGSKTSVPGAPDLHLMFPALYHRVLDTTSILMYTSYDNKVWHKAPGAPVLETATFGHYDGGHIFATPNLVELPNGDWALPYKCSDVPYKYPRGDWTVNTSFAIWPKGRLAAIEAPEEGEFWTVGFMPPGRTIRINAVTHRAGGIPVEVCDFNGKPLPGHTLADATPIVGDQYRTLLSWGHDHDIGVGDGKPIMLHFVMDRAKIYGLDFE